MKVVSVLDGRHREMRVRRKGPGLVGELGPDFFRWHAFAHEIVFSRLPCRAVLGIDEILVIDGMHVNRAAGSGKKADKAAVVGVEMGDEQGRIGL